MKLSVLIHAIKIKFFNGDGTPVDTHFTLKFFLLICYEYYHILAIQNWDFERNVFENSRIAKHEKSFNIVNHVLRLS
jgi:hypothetical protein